MPRAKWLHSVYVMLEALPPNGKLNRNALPPPPCSAPGEAQQQPQGHLEQALASIFCALLQRTHVARHDNFFELGGHSLLTLRLTGQLRELGFAVPVMQLFTNPTVALLAAHLESEK